MFKRNSYSDTRSCSGIGMNFFTENELDRIHCGTLEVLKKTGVFIESEEAQEILAGAGANVDKKTEL